MNQHRISAKKLELQSLLIDTQNGLEGKTDSALVKMLTYIQDRIHDDLLDLLGEALLTDDRMENAGMPHYQRLTCWTCKGWNDTPLHKVSPCNDAQYSVGLRLNERDAVETVWEAQDRRMVERSIDALTSN